MIWFLPASSVLLLLHSLNVSCTYWSRYLFYQKCLLTVFTCQMSVYFSGLTQNIPFLWKISQFFFSFNMYFEHFCIIEPTMLIRNDLLCPPYLLGCKSIQCRILALLKFISLAFSVKRYSSNILLIKYVPTICQMDSFC